jgi:hypothetical protein
VVKKFEVLTQSKEKLVLVSEGASLSHPRGLNSRMGYFMCQNFFVRGQNELRATNANQFQLHVNAREDEYLRYILSYQIYIALVFSFFCWLYGDCLLLYRFICLY